MIFSFSGIPISLPITNEISRTKDSLMRLVMNITNVHVALYTKPWKYHFFQVKGYPSKCEIQWNQQGVFIIRQLQWVCLQFLAYVDKTSSKPHCPNGNHRAVEDLCSFFVRDHTAWPRPSLLLSYSSLVCVNRTIRWVAGTKHKTKGDRNGLPEGYASWN